MSKLPRQISGASIVKICIHIGYIVDHQTGSHIILRQEKEPHRRITIPNHREVSPGALRAIIRQLGLTREEFLELVNKFS